MRRNASLPGGLTAALFGRMVTSDTAADITAPVHVAHAFTAHGEESESDHFTAVDDLSDDEPGADTIQETGVPPVSPDGPARVGRGARPRGAGAPQPRAPDRRGLARRQARLHRPLRPGEPDAPQAGGRQPRSLAEASREPCPPETGAAIRRLAEHLRALDAAYATGEERRFLSVRNEGLDGASRGALAELAPWAGASASSPTSSARRGSSLAIVLGPMADAGSPSW